MQLIQLLLTIIPDFSKKIRKKIRIRTECVQMCVLRCLKFPVFISSHSLTHSFSLFQLFFDARLTLASGGRQTTTTRAEEKRKWENFFLFFFSFRKDENLYSPHQFTVAVCTMWLFLDPFSFTASENDSKKKKTLLTCSRRTQQRRVRSE